MTTKDRKELEKNVEACQKKIERLERELNETREHLEKLDEQRDNEIALFWKELSSYAAGQFRKSTKTNKKLKEAISKLVVKLQESDFYGSYWYYRYLNFDTPDEAMLDPRHSKSAQNFVIIGDAIGDVVNSPADKKLSDNVEKYEKSLFSEKTLVLMRRIPHDSYDKIRHALIRDRWIILSFFYRMHQRDIKKAIDEFVDFVEGVTSKCECDKSAYESDLYHIWVANNNILP